MKFIVTLETLFIFKTNIFKRGVKNVTFLNFRFVSGYRFLVFTECCYLTLFSKFYEICHYLISNATIFGW